MNALTTRNCLTISELSARLSAEHAGAVLRKELWWTLIPKNDSCLWQSQRDPSHILQVLNQLTQLQQPVGFKKIEDANGKERSVGHNDFNTALYNILKNDGNSIKPPVLEAIRIRCKYDGKNPEEEFEVRMAEYKAHTLKEEERIKKVITRILGTPAERENYSNPAHMAIPPFNEDEDEDEDQSEGVVDYEELEAFAPHGSEYLIPIDRIIDLGEKSLEYMARNPKVQDALFATEALLWEAEINTLKAIVQQKEHEGAGEGSREIDNQLLSGAGMAAGMNSGK